MEILTHPALVIVFALCFIVVLIVNAGMPPRRSSKHDHGPGRYVLFAPVWTFALYMVAALITDHIGPSEHSRFDRPVLLVTSITACAGMWIAIVIRARRSFPTPVWLMAIVAAHLAYLAVWLAIMLFYLSSTGEAAWLAFGASSALWLTIALYASFNWKSSTSKTEEINRLVCHSCQYDLSGLLHTNPRCPECGAEQTGSRDFTL